MPIKFDGDVFRILAARNQAGNVLLRDQVLNLEKVLDVAILLRGVRVLDEVNEVVGLSRFVVKAEQEHCTLNVVGAGLDRVSEFIRDGCLFTEVESAAHDG